MCKIVYDCLLFTVYTYAELTNCFVFSKWYEFIRWKNQKRASFTAIRIRMWIRFNLAYGKMRLRDPPGERGNAFGLAIFGFVRYAIRFESERFHYIQREREKE